MDSVATSQNPSCMDWQPSRFPAITSDKNHKLISIIVAIDYSATEHILT